MLFQRIAKKRLHRKAEKKQRTKYVVIAGQRTAELLPNVSIVRRPGLNLIG